jgi:hypothetical protein
MNNAERDLYNVGVNARPDYSAHDQYKLRHQGDLDALRRQAHHEGPQSVTYARYMAALQTGADENLPSEGLNGAIPMHVQDQGQVAAQAVNRQTSSWTRTDNLLHEMGVNGVPFAQLPVDVAIETAAQMAASGDRVRAAALTAAIERSQHSSMKIEFTMPDEDLTYEAPPDVYVSAQQATSDLYTNWRAANAPKPGLAGLAINNNNDAEAFLFAGIQPDGSYQASEDWSRPVSGDSDD